MKIFFFLLTYFSYKWLSTDNIKLGEGENTFEPFQRRKEICLKKKKKKKIDMKWDICFDFETGVVWRPGYIFFKESKQRVFSLFVWQDDNISYEILSIIIILFF